MIGIIAARLKDYFNKPAIVITKSNNILKASARSTPIYNIGNLIKKLIETGYTGRKGKGGFYRVNKTNGTKVMEALNLETGEYYPSKKINIKPSQLAILWCLKNKNVSTVIIGASKFKSRRVESCYWGTKKTVRMTGKPYQIEIFNKPATEKEFMIRAFNRFLNGINFMFEVLMNDFLAMSLESMLET